MLELPEPENALDEKLLADVRTYGWHCITVADELHPEHAKENAARGPHEIYDAAFTYTVGLWLTQDHPELVLVGRWPNPHAVLASAVAIIESGQRFNPDDSSDEVIERYAVCFRAVSRTRCEELLTYASWLIGRRAFDAMQLVLPDASGRWPWDAEYASVPQPLLG
jgi:hypothetical protein